MINYEGIKVDNVKTEGFEVTFPSDMTIAFGPGTLTMLSSGEVHSFPEVEFDIEPDGELNVVYDVYLLAENNADGFNIHIDRTELGFMDVPFYDGEAQLLHCILSLNVPPGATRAADLSINVRNLIHVPQEEAITDEIPSEEPTND